MTPDALPTYVAPLVGSHFDYPGCTRAIRDAMTALSGGAVATEAPTRPHGCTFGTGVQADSHVAITAAWSIDRVLLWGRSTAQALADRLAADIPAQIEPIEIEHSCTVAEPATSICTQSCTQTPMLFGVCVRPDAHVNVVGSSYLGQTEVDGALVANSRYVADYRPSAMAAAADLAVAREAGVVGADHIMGEIGKVLIGHVAGRTEPDKITLYKSLRHVVQNSCGRPLSARSRYR